MDKIDKEILTQKNYEITLDEANFMLRDLWTNLYANLMDPAWRRKFTTKLVWDVLRFNSGDVSIDNEQPPGWFGSVFGKAMKKKGVPDFQKKADITPAIASLYKAMKGGDLAQFMNLNKGDQQAFFKYMASNHPKMMKDIKSKTRVESLSKPLSRNKLYELGDKNK